MQARSFFDMDTWLARIAADHRNLSKARKVALDKPVVDGCFVAGQQITDLALCGTAFPYYGDPRIAAGGTLAGGVIACTLKPAVRLTGMTDAQWSRWKRVFPSGVCDPARPGRDQVPSVPWMRY